MIKPVLIKSFEMKRPFMVWIGFISICCSKVAKEGKSCPRLLVLQRVAQNAKSCSKVAEHNLFMPTTEWNGRSLLRNKGLASAVLITAAFPFIETNKWGSRCGGFISLMITFASYSWVGTTDRECWACRQVLSSTRSLDWKMEEIRTPY